MINKRFLIPAGVLICVGIMLISILGKTNSLPKKMRKKQSIPTLVKVQSFNTNVSDIDTRSFPGVVQPISETKLAFRVGGHLTHLKVSVGQRIKKGEVIARLDQRDFKVRVKRLSAAVDEARSKLSAMSIGARAEDIAMLKAELDAARSRLSESEVNFERYKSLYAEKAVARATYDSAKTGYETALSSVTAAQNALAKATKGSRKEDIAAMKARIKALKADLADARNALSDTELRAPFDGYVHEKFVENFESIEIGDPIISLLDMRFPEVRTRIPRYLIENRALWGHISTIFENRDPKRYPSEIKEIGQMTQGPGQSFPLVLKVKIPSNMIVHPGTAVTVNINFNEQLSQNTSIIVPSSALFSLADGSSAVWRVNPDDMTITAIPVQTKEIKENGISITAEIQADDQIVTAGARFLRNGQKVKILNVSERSRL